MSRKANTWVPSKVPGVNAALPPLAWQTYDIHYAGGSSANGTFKTYLNGVRVQDAAPVTEVTEGSFNGTTLYLQDHRNEAVYNNIRLIPNAAPAVLPFGFLRPRNGAVGTSCPQSDRIAADGIRMTGTTDVDPFFDATGRRLRGGTRNFSILDFHHSTTGH